MSLPTLEILRIRNDAVMPTKAHETDSGYDVTILGVAKQLTSYTSLYHTGLKLKIPPGYHVKMFPRSSLSKTGYMLANSVGIIDEHYRGELLVALTKYDLPLVDLTFPTCVVQIMMEKRLEYDVKEVTSDDFDTNTSRGEGGFGSSNH